MNQLVGFVNQHQFAGLQIDFEQLTPAQIARLVPWLNRLHQRLGAQGKELSIALEAGFEDAEIQSGRDRRLRSRHGLRRTR